MFEGNNNNPNGGQEDSERMIDRKPGETQEQYLARIKRERAAYDETHKATSEQRRQTVVGMKAGADIEVGQDIQDRATILSILINSFGRIGRYQDMASKAGKDISKEVEGLKALGLGNLTLESQIPVVELNQLQSEAEKHLSSIRAKLGL